MSIKYGSQHSIIVLTAMTKQDKVMRVVRSALVHMTFEIGNTRGISTQQDIKFFLHTLLFFKLRLVFITSPA